MRSGRGLGLGLPLGRSLPPGWVVLVVSGRFSVLTRLFRRLASIGWWRGAGAMWLLARLCSQGVHMFERFTDHARRVVVLAQEEARMLNHNYIGTEPILLGLIHGGGGVAGETR